MGGGSWLITGCWLILTWHYILIHIYIYCIKLYIIIYRHIHRFPSSGGFSIGKISHHRLNEAKTPSSISSYISSPSSSSCKFTGFHGTTIRIPRTVGTMNIQCTVCGYLQQSVVLGIHVGKHSIHVACGYDLTYSVIYGRLMVALSARILLRINTSRNSTVSVGCVMIIDPSFHVGLILQIFRHDFGITKKSRPLELPVPWNCLFVVTFFPIG